MATPAVNRDKPHLWKADIAKSVDLYNDWFMRFAPKAFRDTRIATAKAVEDTLKATANLTNVRPELLRANPAVLPSLRMCTCPPLARDRLIGLAGVSKNLVESMEDAAGARIPPRMPKAMVDTELSRIGALIEKLADPDLFVWLPRKDQATEAERFRAATIVADRLCGSYADPIIRNAQEKRQLDEIKGWLLARGYRELPSGSGIKFNAMPPGTFAFRLNVPVSMTGKSINIPVDAVVMPKSAKSGELPLLIEAKSAGDFTNVNKRRKEEATKMAQLKATYGADVRYILFLCGYFDGGYLGYEASEGIDWVWEHRIDDLALFGL